MLQNLRKATAVVSILLVTITITLTLTLTVSAAKAEENEVTIETTATKTTTETTLTNIAYAKTTDVISKSSKGSNETATTTIAETTTTTFLTLQPPPLNVAGPTTASSFQPKPLSEDAEAESVTVVETTKNSINHKIKKASNVTVKSDKKEQNEKKESAKEHAFNTSRADNLEDETILNDKSKVPFLHFPGRGFEPADGITDRDSEKAATKQAGYIDFEEHNPIESISKRKQKKTERVKEVLSNLFPNGFSDIFRFSYASEQQTSSTPKLQTTETPTESAPLTTLHSSTETSIAPFSVNITTTTDLSIPKPSFSYTTSISKQYRRLVSPGHTEIIIEKLPISVSSEEFRDGSNSISKSDFMRINRAAMDASVLPSLLLNPNQGNASKPGNITSAAPIVILKDNPEEHDDLDDEVDDDNQIAESQDIAQHFYRRLPNANSIRSDSLKGKEYQSRQYSRQEPQINVEIIRDDPVKEIQKRGFGQRLFTPASDLPKENYFNKNTDSTPIDPSQDQPVEQQQDQYQQHAEKTFEEPNLTPEAQSRKFLKHFNPQLSESVAGLVKKGNFHYEIQKQRQQQLQAQTFAPKNYFGQPVQPAAQLEFQRKQQLFKKNENQPQASNSQLNLHFPSSESLAEATGTDYKGYKQEPNETPLSAGVVFVTLNTPIPNVTPTPVPLLSPDLSLPGKSPHEYVSEAVAAASQRVPQQLVGKPGPKANAGYTFVEIQKSLNIRNKLITEKDGRLVEQHETIYHQPPHEENTLEVRIPQQQISNDYVSLSTNPINVQHVESEGAEIHEEASSDHSAVQHPFQHEIPLPPPAQTSPPQQTVQVIEKVVPQPYPVPVEKIIERPYPVTQVVETPVPAPYPVKEIVEKFVDRPVTVEKIVERPVEVPYPVRVDHYVDRPYPVHEIIEKHVAVPYAMPEPFAVPVAVDHFIDRPYPVETIVEKRIPYPVEKVVEKIVEKHVPVEKIIEKLVDRPVAVPIHVPVAVPIPVTHDSLSYGHPNALAWTQQPLQGYKIPPKVLQNYYTRMLKKLLTPKLSNTSVTGNAAISTPVPTQPAQSTPSINKKLAQPSAPIQFTKPPFKISDIRYDLRPPPAPLGPSWSKGARYIYNTLPDDLTAAGSSLPVQNQEQYTILVRPDSYQNNQARDEVHEWRMGHLLKRSPDFGRNLHIEYGFKPPLVPSVEIDDHGVPLSASGAKASE